MRLLCVLLLCSAFARAQKPNVIYIMSDDHDKSAVSSYNKSLLQTPNIDRLAAEGLRFRNAFVGNAICAPARATVLTGQHSHKNGHKDNLVRFDSSKTTLPKLLKAAGYQTAVVGKWHLKSLPTGFDFWKVLPGQGLYYQPRLIHMNNDTVTYKGYATDVITDEALQWLDRRDTQKPFFLMLHHKAPHRNFLPPLRHLQTFAKKTVPEPATLHLDTAGRGSAWRLQTMSILHDMKLCGDLKVDPAFLVDIPHLKPDAADVATYNALLNRMPEAERNRAKEIYRERGELLRRLKPSGKELLTYKYQWYMQDILACVASVDENIGRLLDYLDKTGLAGNTVVVYTSDQGFYMGQNGWFDKRFMYDQSMQIPLLARWPGKTKPGTTTDALVQNIDFAPTMLDLAGLPVPAWMQGLSLKPVLLNGKAKLPRTDLYYRFYEYYADHTVLPHLGVRTREHKLIYFYTVDEWEFYDLKNDPQELINRYGQKAYEKTVAEMKEKLRAAKMRYDDTEPAGKL